MEESSVYVIEREDGRIKIGHAGDARKRRERLQTSSAERLALRFTMRFDRPGAMAVEAAAHAKLHSFRLAGEWFAVTSEVAVATVREVSSGLGLQERPEPELPVRPVGRPPSSDRKEVVTLRLRQSTLDAYKARGDDWRARMEAAIEKALEPAKPDPENPEWTTIDFAKAQGPESLPAPVRAAFPKTRAEPTRATIPPMAALSSVQLGPSSTAPGSRLKQPKAKR